MKTSHTQVCNSFVPPKGILYPLTINTRSPPSPCEPYITASLLTILPFKKKETYDIDIPALPLLYAVLVRGIVSTYIENPVRKC